MNSIKIHKSNQKTRDIQTSLLQIKQQDPYQTISSPSVLKKSKTTENSSGHSTDFSSGPRITSSKHKKNALKKQLDPKANEVKKLNFIDSNIIHSDVSGESRIDLSSEDCYRGNNTSCSSYTQSQSLYLPSINSLQTLINPNKNDEINKQLNYNNYKNSDAGLISVDNTEKRDSMQSSKFSVRNKKIVDPTCLIPSKTRNYQYEKDEVDESMCNSIVDLRFRSEILPSISRECSKNLMVRKTEPESSIFSPAKQDVIDYCEDNEERLLVYNEDNVNSEQIINLRKELEVLDLDSVIKRIQFN